MKTMTCRAMGGMCDEPISAETSDEMMSKGMAHLDAAHPEMAVTPGPIPFGLIENSDVGELVPTPTLPELLTTNCVPPVDEPTAKYGASEFPVELIFESIENCAHGVLVPT